MFFGERLVGVVDKRQWQSLVAEVSWYCRMQQRSDEIDHGASGIRRDNRVKIAAIPRHHAVAEGQAKGRAGRLHVDLKIDHGVEDFALLFGNLAR